MQTILARMAALVIAALAVALTAGTAVGQPADYPSKPIRLVSPFNPGGAIDVLNRLIAEKLSARLGQQVIVDAKPGANTIIGAEIVARAPADGYTFLITTNSTHTNNPALYKSLPYDPAKDFAPITQVSLGSVLFVAAKDAPYGDINGFLAWAKSLNRPASYGSWGVGSAGHLYGTLLEKAAPGRLSHVPYKGEVPAIGDVHGGSLDSTFCSPVGAKPQIAAGRIKPLAMTGAARSAAMPDLATFKEQGVEGLDLTLFVAAYAPAGTPEPIVARLQREIKAVIADPEVRQKMLDQGQTPVGSTPAELQAVLAREAPKWAELIRVSGAKVE
ncbi:MAG TPA: tripartite tricarboxylate transporter substrate binding protein [Vineibacter sp.]|nr:tripartite tricarboxylate transporter substrate binding protein [Vineibacter sp.]